MMDDGAMGLQKCVVFIREGSRKAAFLSDIVTL